MIYSYLLFSQVIVEEGGEIGGNRHPQHKVSTDTVEYRSVGYTYNFLHPRQHSRF